MPDAYAFLTCEPGEETAVVPQFRDLDAVTDVFVVTGQYDVVAHLDLGDPPVETIDILANENDIEPRDDVDERVLEQLDSVAGVAESELVFAFDPDG
jgi:uncharacterized protein with GYD domain